MPFGCEDFVDKTVSRDALGVLIFGYGKLSQTCGLLVSLLLAFCINLQYILHLFSEIKRNTCNWKIICGKSTFELPSIENIFLFWHLAYAVPPSDESFIYAGKLLNVCKFNLHN